MFALTDEETEELETLDGTREERVERIAAYHRAPGMDVPDTWMMRHMEDERDEDRWQLLHTRARACFLHGEGRGVL